MRRLFREGAEGLELSPALQSIIWWAVVLGLCCLPADASTEKMGAASAFSGAIVLVVGLAIIAIIWRRLDK